LKRASYGLLILFALSVSRLFAGSPAGQQPVYIYLYAGITDHINLDLSEDRLRRILPMIERYRRQHPEAHVSATVFFSGAVSDALAARNNQTHTLDYVMDFVRRGVIQPGYDGADEPSYKRRPLVDLSKTKGARDRWLARDAVARELLTEARDPVTGALEPGKDGGLKRMQEVFGPAVCITGVTLAVPDAAEGSMPDVWADSELVNEIRRLNTKAIMFGIPNTNVAHAPMFRLWAESFSKAMSPIPQTPPELFWHANVLRTSESSEADVRVLHASDGVEAFQKAAQKLDRSRIRILHVEIANQRNYLTPPFAQRGVYPPIAYAYNHPEHPQLPAEARRAAPDVDAAFAKEDAVLKWLTQDLFSANPGSRFVSSTDLAELALPSTGYDISVDALRSAAADAVRDWGAGPVPPKYLRVDGHYLSLADLFQVMTDTLAELHRSGKLPRSVRVVPVFGPSETTMSKGPGSGEVTGASVARMCAEISGRLHDDAWSPVPKNSIPFEVTVDGITLNAAQFLRLMAETLAAPNLAAKHQVKMTDMFWGRDATDLRTRSMRDEGNAWTYKPASLERQGDSQ